MGQSASDLSQEIMDRLLAGEVSVEQRDETRRRFDARVVILMQAPVERVWDVIISCTQARAFVAGLRHCEVLDERGDFALTHQIVDKGWMTPRLDYTFETRRVAHQRMDFRLAEGNLREMHGSWTFEATGDGLLVRHELMLEPLVPAPGWLVRRNLLKDLPGMMRCIRALAEGSASPEQEKEDRASCAAVQ